MRKLACLGFCFLWLFGCSANQALLMSDADVEQAVSLIDAKNIRVCLKLNGTGTAGSKFQGSAEGFIVGGKNMPSSECAEALGLKPKPSQ